MRKKSEICYYRCITNLGKDKYSSWVVIWSSKGLWYVDSSTV